MICKQIQKKLFLGLIVLLKSYFLLGQNRNEIEAAELLLFSDQKFKNNEFSSSLEKAHKALRIIKEDEPSQIKNKAYLNASRSLQEIGLVHNSLEYILRAEVDNKKFSNIDTQIEIHKQRGIAYEMLNIEESALQEFHKQLKLSQSIKDKNQQQLSILNSYQNIGNTYYKLNQKDSLLHYLHLQQKTIAKIQGKDISKLQSIIYQKLGEYYLLSNEFDRAEHYLNKALKLSKENNNPSNYRIYLGLANALLNKSEISAAINILENAASNVIQPSDNIALYNIYTKLSNIYLEENLDLKKANNYILKAKESKDQIDKNKINAIDQATKIILKEKELDTNKNINNLILISIIAIIGTTIIASLAYNLLKKDTIQANELKKSALQNTKNFNQLAYNEDKFKTLIELAKSNNPEFLFLFKEMYPDFIDFIKSLDPKTRSSELSFLAMTYLNFSTKDISEYTFVTVRAVQVRKNRLRKKYNIDSDWDFNSWMRNKGKHAQSDKIPDVEKLENIAI